MAKIRTVDRIFWGGWNPFIPNYIEIEIKETSRDIDKVVFSVVDTVIGEQEYQGENNETLISEYPLQVIRKKTFSVDMPLYNQLYNVIESQMSSELTPFEKEQLRPKLAFWFYFQNDKIIDANGKEFLLYGKQITDFQLL